MPSPSELVANGRTDEEVGQFIGADRLLYQRLEHLIEAVREGNPEISMVDASCFDGRYITGNVSADFLQTVAGTRSDQAKTQRMKRLRFRDQPTTDISARVISEIQALHAI